MYNVCEDRAGARRESERVQIDRPERRGIESRLSEVCSVIKKKGVEKRPIRSIPQSTSDVRYMYIL
jgi:hypothetical protein